MTLWKTILHQISTEYCFVLILLCFCTTLFADCSMKTPEYVQIEYQNADMVNLQKVCPNIVVDLEFAREDNVLGKQIYPRNDALVRGEMADKLKDVCRYLEQYNLRLKIWAAYRPLTVQGKLYEKYSNPNWISHPDQGRRTHTRGVAIDCTLVDDEGQELDMPTKFLDFDNHEKMASSYPDLPENIKKNRDFLLHTMEKFGLQNYAGEWWHFELPNWSAYWIITKDMEIYEMDKDVIPREDLYK